MSRSAALDHVGVVGRDLAALAGLYETLGFTLTPRAPAAGGRLHNRCVMLRHGYLELMALAPRGTSATIEGFLSRHAGAHVIALSVDDETGAAARLRRAGFDCPGPEQSDRPIDAADADGRRARFIHLPLPQQPEGRVNLIRHLTPDLLWQPRWLDHANRATALDAVILAVAGPAESAARFSRLAGRPVVPDEGGFALGLARGRIRLLPADAFDASPLLPSIVGVTLRTDDANAAIMRIAAAASIPFRIDADGLTVPDAGGVALRFAPGP